MEVFRVGVELLALIRVEDHACLVAFLEVELRDPSYLEELVAFLVACQVGAAYLAAFRVGLQVAFEVEQLQKELGLGPEPSFVEMVHQHHERVLEGLVVQHLQERAYHAQPHVPIQVPE